MIVGDRLTASTAVHLFLFHLTLVLLEEYTRMSTALLLPLPRSLSSSLSSPRLARTVMVGAVVSTTHSWKAEVPLLPALSTANKLTVLSKFWRALQQGAEERRRGVE